MRKSDRYLKIVEWSEEDQCYVGTCPGLMFGGIHGDREAEVFKGLCLAVEEWIDICEQDGVPLPEPTAGKEYSGKFVVRVGPDLHKALAIGALRHGESLNEHCVHLCEKSAHNMAKASRQNVFPAGCVWAPKNLDFRDYGVVSEWASRRVPPSSKVIRRAL